MAQSLLAGVVFSTGKNGATSGGTGADESKNVAGNRTFVFHPPTPSDFANGEFDDQLTWITVGEFYGRLVAAGGEFDDQFTWITVGELMGRLVAAGRLP